MRKAKKIKIGKAQIQEGAVRSVKILLTAVNAKYIHANPALYSLRAYAGKEMRPYLEIAEYTINHKKEEILSGIFLRKPDVIAFSCYIWNWDMIRSLLPEIPKILPDTSVWLGGPEVSFDAEQILRELPMLTGVMTGEGEATFRELARYYCLYDIVEPTDIREAADTCAAGGTCGEAGKHDLGEIKGIWYRDANGEIRRTPERELTDLSVLPFLYEDLEPFTNRIIYYESSRGCPYRCSYCLSSIDKRVRLRDLGLVKKELQFFLDHQVKQVKFVDRTFNCNREHAGEIWRYLSEHDNGITNFHFEIAAELITEEELRILSGMRPGLVQMEIGVQTVNENTLQEIRRKSDIRKLRDVVAGIQKNHNIHIHLDLIAGLPYEDYESFVHSFNSVYEMAPQQLQLGFLKVLKGSYMSEKAADYGMQYMCAPPYEVLSTRWLPYEKLLILKQVEEMVELYYNSGQFVHTMSVLQSAFPDAFTMYRKLAGFYRSQGYELITPSRSYRYQVLLSFAMTTELSKDVKMFREILTFDLYLRENSKSRPDFAKDLTAYKDKIRDFYSQEEKNRYYLADYADYDSRQLARMTHMEVFEYPVWEEDAARCKNKMPDPVMVLFDYRKRDALSGEAGYTIIWRPN